MNDAAPDSPSPVTPAELDESLIRRLVASVQRRAPLDAVEFLSKQPDEVIAKVLGRVSYTLARNILMRFPEQRREGIVPEITARLGQKWSLNQQYPEDSIGRLMDEPVAVFGMGASVRQALERIRELIKEVVFTYAYVVDDEQRLQGVVVMRDLLFAEPEQLLIDIMLTEPFYFDPETKVQDAMLAVVHRHYPVYPVCDAEQRLIGLVQGYVLFEENAISMSAQAGRMVGVEKEEHLVTPLKACLKFRHPWLQINLFTAFLAAGVVGAFEHTISHIVVLAAFLPVLAGQSGNTGCQALAVTLRGMILGEFRENLFRRVLSKEAALGLLNGLLVGLTAGAGMYVYAHFTDSAQAMMLAVVVVLSMTLSCIISGIAGVLVPLVLKRLGADPVTASSIFLTTATDVTSMGLLLGLATALLM